MMTYGRIVRSSAIGAMALAFGATMASAGTITYTTSVGPDATDWASSLTLPQFHPGSGTLNSVSVLFDGTVTGSLQLSNTGTFAGIATQTAALPGSPAAFGGSGGSGTKTITGLTASITSKLFVGEILTGNKGIAAGTTITAVNPTSITISKNQTLSGAKTLTPVCTATMCSDWKLNYHAAPPAVAPTDTINSTLSAKVTLHVSGGTIALSPSVSSTDVLDYGPKYNPATYDFADSYSGTPITLAAAQALPPPAGIPAPPGGISNPCAAALYGDCVVDGRTYHTGVSHLGLSDTESDSLFYSAPADLAAFIGGGDVAFAVDSLGISGTNGGGNISFLSTTNAGAVLTLTYDYTPPTHTGSVPEPISLSVFAGGLLGIGAMRRRKIAKTGRG